MRPTYEDLMKDPAILDRMIAEARRERSKAVHELIVEPIKRMFSGHASRPHLARQG